jgi:cell fate regulator YaaT (PSP1 superfamily)
MKEVIGVRFRPNGKIYFFDPQDFYVQVGTEVIVETARGVEYGKCVQGRRKIEDPKRINGLKPILRIANDEDRKNYEKNKQKSKDAFVTCEKKIKEHNLEMKLISAEYTFDGSKVLFYFTADGRVDFRDLVRDLASVFKTRIELRQIGVRDEAKLCGGIGMCGRPLCCNSYLSEFIPVSIKMAKEQNLSLNPTKISGVCGRLMCCLKHEQDAYEYLNAKMPMVGDNATTPEGVVGRVDSVNVMRQTVRIIITDEEGNKTAEEYKVEELKFKPRKKPKKDKNQPSEDKELAALEALEREEGRSKLNDD